MNPYRIPSVYGYDGFAGFDGFFRKVTKVAKSAVKAGVRMHTQPFRIAKDIKQKGWKKGLKAIPSRVFVDPIKDGNRILTDTARVIARPGTKLASAADRFDRSNRQFQKWTQKRPLQTTLMAAAAVGAAIAAPAAIAAVGAGGAAAGGAGAGAAAAGGISTTGVISAVTTGLTVATTVAKAVAAKKAAEEAEEAAAAEQAAATEAAIMATTGTEVPTATAVDSSGRPLGQGGGAFAPLAGAGAGFLVAGPVGAIVGGIAGVILSKKKAA
jgi:ribosomal protein L31E